MNHDKAKILIDDYIDEKLDPETALELEQHINDCNLCADTVYSIRKLKEDIDNLSSKIPPGRNLWKDVSAIIHDKKIKTIEDEESSTKIRNIGDSKKSKSEKSKKKTKEFKKGIRRESSLKNIFNSKNVKIILSVFIFAVAAYLIYYFFFSGPQWQIINQTGNVKVNGKLISNKKSVGSEDIILTDLDSKATLKIPEAGKIILNEESKIERTDKEYFVKLHYGSLRVEKNNSKEILTISAGNKTITSRQPDAEYNLEINRDGNGLIAVTSGMVLIQDYKKVIVPKDFRCKFYSERIGVPYQNNSSIEFVTAIDQLLYDQNINQALDLILNSADISDAISIFYILEFTPLQERVRVFNTLYNLVPPPPGVKKGGVLNLEKNMLDNWFNKIMANY